MIVLETVITSLSFNRAFFQQKQRFEGCDGKFSQDEGFVFSGGRENWCLEVVAR